MKSNLSRRGLFRIAGAAAAGAVVGGISRRAVHAAEPVAAGSPAAEKLGWLLSGALYTFRRFSFYEALDMIASLGLKYVEPCYFLRLDKDHPDWKTSEQLGPPQRKEMIQKMADRGLAAISYYAQLGSDESAARKTFDFAKEMGARTIVAEPPPEAFDMLAKLCDQYAINLAVHNHPQSPQSRYWKPEAVLEVCRGRNRRVGACCDTGHWVRSGIKPVECLKKMEGRILSLHLKDVERWGEPKARDVPLGAGLADYGAVLKELHRQGFRGVMGIEYEHDSPQLMEEVAQCIAFVEKTAKSIAG